MVKHERNQDEIVDQEQQNETPKMGFSHIPPDMMVEIAEHLDSVNDLLAIAVSCRVAYYSINPVLYKYDARHQQKALWGAGCAVPNRFQLSFAVGAQINRPLHLEGGAVSSPLHMAVKYGNADVVLSLAYYGADLEGECLDPKPDFTPLQEAVLLDSTEIAEALLKKGANINGTNATGITPLYIALRLWRENMTNENKAAMINLLLSSGADVSDLGYGWMGPFIVPKQWRNKHPLDEEGAWKDTQMTGSIDAYIEPTGIRTSDIARYMLREAGLGPFWAEHLMSCGLQPDDLPPEKLELYADQLESFTNDEGGLLRSLVDAALTEF